MLGQKLIFRTLCMDQAIAVFSTIRDRFPTAHAEIFRDCEMFGINAVDPDGKLELFASGMKAGIEFTVATEDVKDKAFDRILADLGAACYGEGETTLEQRIAVASMVAEEEEEQERWDMCA